MKCPSCSVNLVMADRGGIEIDYCPDCRGVWLDRGELDKIIERSNTPPQREKPFEKTDRGSFRGDDSDFYKRKRKKGLLGEIFDF